MTEENNNITANLNNSQCVQSTNNIGSTTYQNICDNTTHVVPWGSADWFGVLLVLGVTVGIVWIVRVAYND